MLGLSSACDALVVATKRKTIHAFHRGFPLPIVCQTRTGVSLTLARSIAPAAVFGIVPTNSTYFGRL